QAPDSAARLAQALAAHLLPDLARAVDGAVLLVDPPNDHAQHVITLAARRALCRVALLALVLEVRRWGDRQHRADRLDPKTIAMRIDVRDHHFTRRSSAA